MRLGIAIAATITCSLLAPIAARADTDEQAAARWFATDPSLGCFNQQAQPATCGARNNPEAKFYKGNATGGPGEPDMIVAVTYTGDPTGNAQNLAVAAFRQDGNTWRFVRRFPNVYGLDLAPGTSVHFGGGHATMTRLALKPSDPRCCPTGRQTYTLPLR